MLHVVAYVNRSISLWNSCKHSEVYGFILSDTPLYQTEVTQECITVGCVPPAAVAVCRGGLPPCMLGYTTSVVGLETPPQVWAWKPPPPSQSPQPPPWVWAWSPLEQNS